MMQQSKAPRTSTRIRHNQPGTVMRAVAAKDSDHRSNHQGLVSASLKSIRLSTPDDPQEREADNMADQVMRMSRLNQTRINTRIKGQAPFYIARQEQEEEEPVQAMLIQRQPEEEEEPVQAILIQRQSEEEEEEAQPRRIYRRATTRMQSQPGIPRETQAEIRSATTGGQPLSQSLRQFMEPRFNADFSNVRVHTDGQSARLNNRISARAFAYRNHLFFGDNQFRPDTDAGKRLIAHELTHTIQQGASPRQTQSRRHRQQQEQIQNRVQRNRQQPATVQHHTDPMVQRLGISDALDYFAERAFHIPGFRMLTILIGVNPINMSRTERTPSNILRAVVEFLPGGHLITQALDNHGILTRVANWIMQQLSTLAITGNIIRQAIMQFLDSLRLNDIFDLSGVWQRARRIFTEPISQVINFARSLVNGILDFIKEVILMPLARLASRTRGWGLLCAVLGRNPITGDPVERNAENLIGGFMRLIGREDIWENLRRANAIPRAWAWFHGALNGLRGFVLAIPQLFLNAFAALRIADLLSIPSVLARIAHVFAGFVFQFMRWGGQQILTLLRIIFEVVAPNVVPFLSRARSTFHSILRNPVGFVRNLIRAAILGFRRFARNILRHLQTALINWLTETLSGSGVYIPQSFAPRELIKFVLSVLGITWQNVRRKLVRAVGERAVSAMERSFALVRTLITEGPAALWQRIREGVTNLRQMVIEQIMQFVAVRIVQAAITRVVSMFNPAGAVIQAIIAIYNTIMFFVERLRTIAQVASSFVNSIIAIARGAIVRAAIRVERSMAGALTLVISFLARLLGLGNISRTVRRIINRIRRPVDRALDRIVRWIVRQARHAGHLSERRRE